VHGERELFERLVLEAFQTGLSWITVLRRREAFRLAFAGFNPEAVAAYTDVDVERLLQNRGIVRNRMKIEAAISNARALARLHGQSGTLEDIVWSHRPAGHRRPRTWADVPSQTEESAALTRALKQAGFRFVGPVTAYAAMQACGLVNDHLLGCPAG
jgi:DNA-3-methyladenine glycosylase I